jgi:hypothetical protein
MPRSTNARSSSRISSREPGIRSRRGETSAQLSKYLATDEVKNPGVLHAPTLTRTSASLEPYTRTLPTMVELTNASKAELARILDEFGITKPWAQQRAANVGYLMRMTEMVPGSPAFKSALDDLVGMGTQRAALAATRRAYHEYMAIETDTGGILLRVAENDKNTCEVCNALAGEEGTIEYHRELGMPGASSCDGGDLCRCNLLSVGSASE